MSRRSPPWWFAALRPEAGPGCGARPTAASTHRFAAALTARRSTRTVRRPCEASVGGARRPCRLERPPPAARREEDAMSFRLAAYAVCIEDRRVLLVRHVSNNWTLPGGRV